MYANNEKKYLPPSKKKTLIYSSADWSVRRDRRKYSFASTQNSHWKL